MHGKLDIMFNNAGIINHPKPSIVESNKSDFERVLGINVIGVFLGTKHAARVMIPTRRGSIINTSSLASIISGITPHAYTSSKHAVVGLTENAAVELGQSGIRVNCVSPYLVPSAMTSSLFKMGEEEMAKKASVCSILKGVTLEAEDIAQAALYLGSDESRGCEIAPGAPIRSSIFLYIHGPTEDKERSQLDPTIEEQKRLKSLALLRNLLSNAPSKPISPLTPSNLILKHQGKDIVKKGQRKNIFLFSFPGLLAPVSAGKIGKLKDIGTKNPVLYIDFPQGWMKLFGTIVYPKNKYLTLQFARGEKKVTCEDCFENMKKPLLRVTTGVFHGRQLLDERDLHFITIELTRHAYHSAWHIMKRVNVEGPNSALPFPQVEALSRTIPLASHLRKWLTLTTPPLCFGGACNTNGNDSGTGSSCGSSSSSSSSVFDNNSDSERGSSRTARGEEYCHQRGRACFEGFAGRFQMRT
ncbi:hypothetical protein AAC387_Pa08g1510 [Persea americana]